MARKTVTEELASRAEFSELHVEHSASDLQLAQSHAIGRNRRLGFFLCYLSLLRGCRLLKREATVECRGAAFQHFRSSHGRQAAHYLPGQIYLSNRLPSDHVGGTGTKEDVDSLFADVQDLPADYNKADTLAEASRSDAGLCQAFARASRIVVLDPRPAASKINRDLVLSAYRIWCADSRQALAIAIGKRNVDLPAGPRPGFTETGALDPHLIGAGELEARQGTLDRIMRPGRTQDTLAGNWLAQQKFLETYLRLSDTWHPHPSRMDKIEQRFCP